MLLCVDTPVNWVSDAALGLYSAVNLCVCVCARTVWQIFKALGASKLWHLLSEEELRSFSVGGWVDVCEEDTVRWDVTVLESLPEAYVIPGDKKLKELWEHIWIEDMLQRQHEIKTQPFYLYLCLIVWFVSGRYLKHFYFHKITLSMETFSFVRQKDNK